MTREKLKRIKKTLEAAAVEVRFRLEDLRRDGEDPEIIRSVERTLHEVRHAIRLMDDGA